ncbi:MAG: nickel transporter permease NikC [Methanosaeta sp. PtaB.Bin039]|nr:MAG: nickel transporter permease NikC [Methanosaeta sp. PtaB.Bin039]
MRENNSRRQMLLGFMILSAIALVAFFAGMIAPHEPNQTNLGERLSPPSWQYPFGNDNLGRCILSRIIFAARISLYIGVVVVSLSLLIGVALGSIAGYFGGLLDELIMRFVDAFLAFPSMFLALAVIGLMGPGLSNLILALVVVEWTGYARMVRGEVISLKGKEFLEAARSLGAKDSYILVRHVLPNVLAPVLVMSALGIGFTILAASGLSFLGLGVQPGIPEWGSMLDDGRLYLRVAPHLMIFPGLAITITVLAFNLLGEGLRDELNPRLGSSIHEDAA